MRWRGLREGSAEVSALGPRCRRTAGVRMGQAFGVCGCLLSYIGVQYISAASHGVMPLNAIPDYLALAGYAQGFVSVLPETEPESSEGVVLPSCLSEETLT